MAPDESCPHDRLHVHQVGASYCASYSTYADIPLNGMVRAVNGKQCQRLKAEGSEPLKLPERKKGACVHSAHRPQRQKTQFLSYASFWLFNVSSG